MTSDRDYRITAVHRGKDALIYVRQSTPEQVLSNTESTRIQIGLREKAVALGWPHPVLIDDDLGVSASGYSDRPGFQQLLTRVAMDNVGIILCVDASRLSRNSKDWAHLFELCGFFSVLIADQDQVYDLSQPNDRLIIGIKGTVSEMELTILRNRLRSGAEAKAARGELRCHLPAGYVYDASDEITLDADKRVQKAISRMFDQFDCVNSVRQLAMWYRDTESLFPVKKMCKNPRTSWEVPTAKTLKKLLVHPIYSGAYVYGRRVSRVDYVDGKLVKRQGECLPLDQCRVCIRDHHPAYITWERLVANDAKIAENRPRWNMLENRGAIRDGLALLAGLLRCGQCGRRIYVNYKKSSSLYYCDGGHTKGARRCLSFGSQLIDRAVSTEVLRVIEPLSVDVAIAAAKNVDQEWTREIEAAELQIQAAQYEADRAFEQFDAVDPKNRLVADTLEERLNDKLSDLHRAKERLQTVTNAGNSLTKEHEERLHDLARSFPEVWNHPNADGTLKKRLLRTAIHEILVALDDEQEHLQVTIHWHGGVHTRLLVKKRSAPASRHKTSPQLVDLVRQLAREVSDAEAARVLNMKKMTTTRGLCWTQDRVEGFRKQHRIRLEKPRAPSDDEYLTQNEAIEYLGIGHNGILGLERIGAVSRNQVTDFAPWRVSKKQLDSDHVQSLVSYLKDTGRLPRGGSPKDQALLFDDKHRT